MNRVKVLGSQLRVGDHVYHEGKRVRIRKVSHKVFINDGIDPDDCVVAPCSSPKGMKIAKGKYAQVGDVIWVWRISANPALVRKVVVELRYQPRFSRMSCAYEDCGRGYAEYPKDCYASEEEALRARPELARRREHCYMRMGRVLGHRVHQKRKAA